MPVKAFVDSGAQQTISMFDIAHLRHFHEFIVLYSSEPGMRRCMWVRFQCCT